MKIQRLIIAFLATLAVLLFCTAKNLGNSVELVAEENRGLKTKIERLDGIQNSRNFQADIDRHKITRLETQCAELTEENARLQAENASLRDYIDGFWEFMEGEYDFEGHQDMHESEGLK